MSEPHESESGVTVSIREIHRIAALARLRLEEGEAERMAREMSSILEHMAVLAEVAVEAAPTPGVPRGKSSPRPGEDSGGTGSATLEGEATPDSLERPLSRMAPDWRDGFFVVPRLPGVAGASGERDDSR